MKRNRLILLTVVVFLILTGIWAYPKIDQFIKADTCSDKVGDWNNETREPASGEGVTDSPKIDSLNGYNQLADVQNRERYTISEYNTDLETENIDRPEKTVIINPTFDTTCLFKTWTTDRDGPHADFWMNKNEFFVVDYDGDGAMPYILKKDSLTIFYNDFVQKGVIVSISKETLIIHWDQTGKPTKYIEWKK